MKIGIDLDNTLVDYQAAFLAAAALVKIDLPLSVRSKSQIREFLRLQPDGEYIWQKLQGLAYGRCVKEHARPYPGVKRFLWRCRQRGYYVAIVSHKTEHGHGDIEKIPLREVALEFLAAHGLFGNPDAPVKDVRFENTYEGKIACIKDQLFDWFIDDLPEVISDLGGVAGLKSIHFFPSAYPSPHAFDDTSSITPLSDWQQIDVQINGEWTLPEINQLSSQVMKSDAIVIEQQSSGGNAGVYRLALSEEQTVKLKIYPVDPVHDRLRSEFTATKVLAGSGSIYVARPLAQHIDLGIGVYEWLEGDPINAPGQEDLETSLAFLGSLHALRNSSQFVDAPLASAACLSGRNIETQIRYRLQQFEIPRKWHAELDDFLVGLFLPAYESLLEWVQDNWPDGDDYDTPLDRSLQTLSPSDFGFHNALRRPDGSLAFFDFEYFGWDDPVKLMSDFTFHQGMSLTYKQKAFWLKGALRIYGEQLSARLNVCRPLYGLIWCLILLNDFRPEVWQRRSLADNSKRDIKQEILNRQLARAETLLQEVTVGHAGLFAEIRH